MEAIAVCVVEAHEAWYKILHAFEFSIHKYRNGVVDLDVRSASPYVMVDATGMKVISPQSPINVTRLDSHSESDFNYVNATGTYIHERRFLAGYDREACFEEMQLACNLKIVNAK